MKIEHLATSALIPYARNAKKHDAAQVAKLAGSIREFDYQPFDLAVLFLCLMFVPPSKRGEFISRLRARIRPGGAIIVFDKCEPATGYVATVLWRLALAGKAAAGVDAREILAKELSLGGIQRPINPREIEPATEIFRFGDFAGWIIEP